jgi:hypothetical protein
MKRLVAFALTLGVLVSLAAGNASASSGLTGPALRSPGGAAVIAPQLHARYGHPATHLSSRGLTPAIPATTVPLWSHKVVDGGATYTYTMVGKNPFVAQANPTSTTPVYLFPLKLVFTSFGNATFDPGAADPCDTAPHPSNTQRVRNSPLFNAVPWEFGGTSVGTAQYIDAFQRANFYTQTNPSGINPGYNANLGSTNGHVVPITINVSGGDVLSTADGVGCGSLGLMDFATWDNYIQTQLMPLLAAQSPQLGGPKSLPIFLLHDVVLYNGSTANCCILGYHSAFGDPAYAGAFHTYVSADYESSKTFTNAPDTSVLSHEIGEWLDDPAGNNPTPSWGNIGQVSGCQGNLEVGDPLSGNTLRYYNPATNFTYHLQELAFASWFYHQKKSTGVNGWYSNNDTLETPAAPC